MLPSRARDDSLVFLLCLGRNSEKHPIPLVLSLMSVSLFLSVCGSVFIPLFFDLLS